MFKCYPGVNEKFDKAYWVSVNCFFSYFNQCDLINNRDAKQVIDAYSKEWFYSHSSGRLVFILPSIHLIDGKTQFINGRHRTSVLVKHLDFLPIAFSKSAREFALKLNFKPVDLTKSIELPKLQVLAFNSKD